MEAFLFPGNVFYFLSPDPNNVGRSFTWPNGTPKTAWFDGWQAACGDLGFASVPCKKT
jgi:hypothetical protein